jgi:uracil-DNA glycosylase
MAASSTSNTQGLAALAERIAACRRCVEAPDGKPLPHEPRPVVRLSPTARILIAGQAPGIRVHKSGVPFTDPSGDRLRSWMGVDSDTFYDPARVAIVPMGFCFPGFDAKGGDLPPRRECRTLWHDEIFAAMPQIDLILAIGAHAQDYHLRRLGLPVPRGEGLSERVHRWREFATGHPRLFPLPHPSWRNSGWLKRNPWFETDLLPDLRHEIASALAAKTPARGNV